MILQLNRKEIFKHKKTIASEIRLIQQAVFDEDILDFYETEIEKNDYLENFDALDLEINKVNNFSKLIELDYFEITTYTKNLSEKLIELFNYLNATNFYIISHLKTDFFGNFKNKYKPLVKAYQKLEAIVGKVTYKEAFEINISSLVEFLEILFWTSRCDPSTAEYVFIFDKEERFQFHLCQYGNIHLTEYDKEILSKELIENSGLKLIEEDEYDKFGTNGKIEGRKLEL